MIVDNTYLSNVSTYWISLIKGFNIILKTYKCALTFVRKSNTIPYIKGFGIGNYIFDFVTF